MAELTISIDEQDKSDIAAFCAKAGLTVQELYNAFTQKVLREKKVPFDLDGEVPNKRTIRAMREGDRLIEKYIKNPKSVKTYTVDEAIKAMKSW